MSRYTNSKIITNASEYYAPLRKGRHAKIITQYATPKLHNPGVAQRAQLAKSTHIWKYGDRFYQLAHQYYGDARFWWVIAWYNGYPTEADVPTGSRLAIPVNLEHALKVLRG